MENQFGTEDEVEFTPRFVKGPMLKTADELDRMINPPFGKKRNGYIIMVFPFGDENGRCNLMTNMDRSQVVPLLQMQIEQYEEEA